MQGQGGPTITLPLPPDRLLAPHSLCRGSPSGLLLRLTRLAAPTQGLATSVLPDPHVDDARTPSTSPLAFLCSPLPVTLHWQQSQILSLLLPLSTYLPADPWIYLLTPWLIASPPTRMQVSQGGAFPEVSKLPQHSERCLALGGTQESSVH